MSQAAPGVTFGDAGEFAAAAATLSVPHAPGYPLFCLMAKAFGTLLPVGTWAFRVNLFSVFCGAAAGAVFLDALRRVGLERAGRIFAVFALCFSAPWLHNTLQTEVFALHALFASLCLWVAAAYRDNLCDPRPAAALGLALGLGGANHHTLILLLPPLLLAAWLHTPRRKQFWRALPWFFGFALLGLSAYAYLPIRAAQGPPLNWGNPVDLPRFIHVLLRRDYGSFSLTVEGSAGGWTAVVGQCARFLRETLSGLGAVVCLAAVAGIGRRRWKRDALPLGLLLTAGPGFLMLGNPPYDPVTGGALERFFLLPWFGAAWLAGGGVDLLARRFPRGAYALAAAPVLGALLHTGAWAQRWDLAAHDYGRNLLRSLPPDAVIFMDGGDDTFYTVANLLYAQGLRPDLAAHDRGGLVFAGAYGADFRRLPKSEKEGRRRDVETGMADAGRAVFYATLQRNLILGRATPLRGLLRRLGSPGSVEEDAEDAAGAALWSVYPLRIAPARAAAYYRYRALVPFYAVMRAQAEAARGEHQRVLRFLYHASVLGGDAMWLPATVSQIAEWTGFHASRAGRWELAAAAYRAAAAAMPSRADPWMNLGVAMERLGRMEPAAAAYARAVQLAPESHQAHYNFGAFLWKAERWREAESAFARAAALRPEDEQARRFAAQAAARAQ